MQFFCPARHTLAMVCVSSSIKKRTVIDILVQVNICRRKLSLTWCLCVVGIHIREGYVGLAFSSVILVIQHACSNA